MHSHISAKDNLLHRFIGTIIWLFRPHHGFFRIKFWGMGIMRLVTSLSFSTKHKELQDVQILPWCCSAENLKACFCRRERKNISRLVEIQHKVMGFGLSCFAFFFLRGEWKQNYSPLKSADACVKTGGYLRQGRAVSWSSLAAVTRKVCNLSFFLRLLVF